MKRIYIIIIVLLSITGCKKTHCPEFPTNLNFFPYYNGQEIKFVNAQQNIQSFKIVNTDKSKAYSFEWNCKCVCEAYSGFRTDENTDSLSLQGEFVINGTRTDDIASSVSVSFYFKYSYQYNDYFSTDVNFEKNITYNDISQYLDDTISIEIESGKIVKKIVIAKGKGLVSYTTIDGEEWRLTE